MLKSGIKPAKKIKPIFALPKLAFPKILIIKRKNKAIHKANATTLDLKLWCDRFKLDIGDTGAVVISKKNCLSKKWQELKISLGQNKKVFDLEVWGIFEAFKIIEKRTR